MNIRAPPSGDEVKNEHSYSATPPTLPHLLGMFRGDIYLCLYLQLYLS